MTRRCANGHDSKRLDYCDECGLSLDPATERTVVRTRPPAVAPAAATAGRACPNPGCGALSRKGDHFCEACGTALDGSAPDAAAARGWDLAATTTRMIPLDSGPLRLGGDLIEPEFEWDDPPIIRRHATIVPHGDGYAVIDHRSKTGTTVNDVVIPPEVPYPLAEGDVVDVGIETTFTFRRRG